MLIVRLIIRDMDIATETAKTKKFENPFERKYKKSKNVIENFNSNEKRKNSYQKFRRKLRSKIF